MHKILIIAPSWVGDLVMAQSLFRLLKQKNQNLIIHVLAIQSLLPLLERMPEVDKAVVSTFTHGQLGLRQRFALAKILRLEKYTQAIVLPNSFKSALIPFWAKIPLRTGWRGEMRYGLLNDWRRLNKENYPLMVDRFLALGMNKNEACPGQDVFWPVFSPTSSQIDETLMQTGITSPLMPVMAICPGAEYGPAKRWPGEYFAKVAETKVREGWGVWIFGGPKDWEIGESINNACGNICLNLAGRTNLGQVIDLLALTKVVVTNDTGLMHVAAALARPLVAIYGSSSPVHTPPLCRRQKILSLNLPCSPCFKRECEFGHLNCLQGLRPESVLAAISGLVN